MQREARLADATNPPVYGPDCLVSATNQEFLTRSRQMPCMDVPNRADHDLQLSSHRKLRRLIMFSNNTIIR